MSAHLLHGRSSRGVALVVTLSLGALACDESASPAPADVGDAILADTQADEVRDGPAACLSERDRFLETVWTPVLEKKCLTCHQPGGLAWEEKARLVLVPATYPGFQETNIEALRSMLRYAYEGEPLLLAKPTNLAPHGGGPVLEPGSAAHEAFRAWIEAESSTSATDDACTPALPWEGHPVEPAFATFRRAALNLTGRSPTPAERAALEADPEQLTPMLEALMAEPGFTAWLKTAWNDVLLVDLYRSNVGRATNLLNSIDFPGSRDAWFNTLSFDERRLATEGIAHEPLELIAWVVREGLPFTEILTADHTVVNTLTAPILNAELEDDGATDPLAMRPARAGYMRDGAWQPWPHAGILSSPMVLNRFPTTPTNLNRHRAWWVLRTFIATDVLTVADRPVDPDQASAFTLPWRQDSQCVVCHAVIDPVAGGWAGFDDRDPDRYFPGRNAPPDVFDPGYEELLMPADPTEGRLGWLAARIAEDRRFPYSVARLTASMWTGRPPIDHPRGADRPTFGAERRAWQAYDAMLVDVTAAFKESGLDYRRLLAAIIAHPLNRIDGFATPTSPAATSDLAGPEDEARAALAPFGHRRWLTPELLDRRIEALLGFPWRNTNSTSAALMTEYRLLYGGIDSEQVTVRLDVPNGVMGSISERMSNEVACTAAAWEFAQAPEARRLLGAVSITDTPTTAQGDAIPAATGRIREALANVHNHLLGESVSADSEAVDELFALFRDIQEAGRRNVADGSEPSALACRARNHPVTRELLPTEQRVESDPDYTVRAWMAVISYVLSDYRFLSQ